MFFNDNDSMLKEKLDKLKTNYLVSTDPNDKKRYYNIIFALLYGRFKDNSVMNMDLFYKYCYSDSLYLPILVDIENMRIQQSADRLDIHKALNNIQNAINVLKDVINRM